jgi:ornithine cyclodeaminase/alanine dehydrogenase-like protein (mu-crystallin family)
MTQHSPPDQFAVLSRAEVAGRLPPLPDQIELAAKTFRALAAGRVEMPPKTAVHPRENGFCHAMPAYLMDDDVVALKWISGYRENPSKGLPYICGLIVLNDADTGLPLAVLDGAEITAVRTAAASALCVERLAPPGWSRAAILGAGEQGRHHAAALREINPGCEIVGYDPMPERVEGLCDDVIAAGDPLEAVDDAQVVITAGPILENPAPVLSGDALTADCLLLPLDFDAYLQAPVVESARHFIVDSIAQFEYYRESGYFAGWPVPRVELGQALDEVRPGGRIVCANLGVGALDAAFAHAVMESTVSTSR